VSPPLIQTPDRSTFVDPSPVRDDAGLRVWRVAGQTRRLVVCFSGVGPADGALAPEFLRLIAMTPRDHLLFIADPARSWLNRPGLIDEITAVIEAEVAATGATQICTLGHSMGGFCAVVISAFTRVDCAVAFAPQFSVDPALVPAEDRWQDLRDQIPTFTIGNADDYVQPRSHYIVFFGAHRREAPQRDLVRPRPNLDLFVIPRTHHNVPQRLKDAGILDQILTACFDNRLTKVENLLIKHVEGRKAALPA